MAKAELSTLPIELREGIWMLTLLPDPGVYHFDPDCFTPLEDIDGFEDERWMVPKRKYPTAMHVCQESRRLSLQVMEREQKHEQENGSLPFYCLGCDARPFNPEIDTFWFSQESLFNHAWVINCQGVIGDRVHTIKNLALSQHCIKSLTPNTGTISNWDSFRWHRLGRFVSLRRVDVIFGLRWVDDDSECGSGGRFIGPDNVSELRLEKWTEGSSTTETLDEVETKINTVKANVTDVFQHMFERMQESEIGEPPLPKGAPGWQDGSKITFHAAQLVKVGRS